MSNRTNTAIRRATKRSDARTNPRWLTIWLDQLPYSYRFPSYAILKDRAAKNGFCADVEGVKAFVIDVVSGDVRREALRLYGEAHPQADPAYRWAP